jgi:hypothetical protein
VDAFVSRRASKEVVPDYNLNSYEFDFGLDPIEPESELNTTEESLSGPAANLVITSTTVGRFIYCPECKPVEQTDDNSRCVTYLETLGS